MNTFTAPTIDWTALSPILITLGGAVVVLLVSLFLPLGVRRPFAAAVAGICFVAAGAAAIALFAADDDRPRDRRGRDPPRPPGRVRPGARHGDRAPRRARLLPGAGQGGPRRRVLRAPPDGDERDGVLRRREQPDDALPRPRVVLDLPLHPHGHRGRAAERAGGEPQVPDRRQLRLRDPALRERVRLRRDRRARLRRDRGGNGRRRAAVRRRRPGDDHRRPGVQGLRSPVPHVDARRLRGRADAGHRASWPPRPRWRPSSSPCACSSPPSRARRSSGRSRSR